MKNKRTALLRLAALLLLAVSLIPLAVSCGEIREDDGKINIVCTTFPLYDWTKNIVGESENVTVELLVSSGTDLHSFQPSVADIAKISNAELLIHIGGSSDTWVQNAAKQADGLTVLTLSETEGIKLLSLDGEEHEHSQEKDDHSHGEFDEHIWLSLKNAILCSERIAESISALDKSNAEKYSSNLLVYTEKLSALDREYSALTKNKELLFADRFPFGYLVSDYDIGYHAAFRSCSADTDASFETVIELASIIDRQGLTCVIVTESSDQKLAKSIIAETESRSAKILTLDSMQSVTAAHIQSGYSYLSAMQNDLEVIKIALK